MKMIVEPAWLHENLDNPSLLVLDASYPKVTGERSEHEGLQIPGARRFDIDFFSDQEKPLPHMLAPVNEFQLKAQALGINRDSHIVIYDNFGIYSSPRAWWMFRVMGHEQVSVLNGGMPEWVEAGFRTEPVASSVSPKGDFIAQFRQDLVKSFEQVEANISARSFEVIDARSVGRFAGTAPEPRPELSSGHIPGSMSLPFTEVLDGNRFISENHLKRLFNQIESEKPLTFSCGSGLTACITMLAAQQVLGNPMSIYDGSWTEWAGNGGKIEKQV